MLHDKVTQLQFEEHGGFHTCFLSIQESFKSHSRVIQESFKTQESFKIYLRVIQESFKSHFKSYLRVLQDYLIFIPFTTSIKASTTCFQFGIR